MPPRILISAGEASGEMHAARLAAALKARTGAEVFGLGGARMSEAGVDLVADSHDVAVVGITEVVRRLPSVWRVFQRLVAESARRKPDLAILVDFPDFNLRLARRLHAQGVRIVYFISPQVWAWRPKRVKLIKRLVERVLCIFPFEEKFYQEAGVPVNFVGYPLVDFVKATKPREQLIQELGLAGDLPVVAILPGSRKSEIVPHKAILDGACHRLEQTRPHHFLMAAPPNVEFDRRSPVRMIQATAYDALAAADIGIVASGTATVEAALLGTPMVVVYRVSEMTAFIARRLVRTPHFAMVNLIAGRRVVPEFIQDDFTPEAVAREVQRLLTDSDAREQMKRDLAEVRAQLGPGGAIDRAAAIIAGMLR